MRGAAAPLRDRSDRAVLLNPRGSARAIVKRRNQAALCGSVSRAEIRQDVRAFDRIALSVQVGSSAKSARLGDSVKLRFLREAVQIGRYAKAARSRRGRAGCILYGIARSGIMRDRTRIPKSRAVNGACHGRGAHLRCEQCISYKRVRPICESRIPCAMAISAPQIAHILH